MMARSINRDRKLINQDLLLKVDAVCRDVTDHLPSGYRLAIFEGWRDPRQQKALVDAGVSKTLHSRHNIRPAQAVDLMFQKKNLLLQWKWLSWKDVSDRWLRWLMSSKRSHGLAARGLDWDKPHCQIID